MTNVLSFSGELVSQIFPVCLCVTSVTKLNHLYRYLNLKIQEGEAHHITCPAYGCSRLVPVDIIESVVSRQMARKYLQFDIQVSVGAE